MTVYHNTRLLVDGAYSSDPGISSTVYRMTTFIADLGTSFAKWNSARKTRAELEKLSDHTLDDIGLTRGDIPYLTIHR